MLAGLGLPQEQIGRVIGVSHVTLRKHYAEQLEAGVSKANARVLESLYNLATSGPPAQRAACAIFWAKTRLGWAETIKQEHTGADGGPIRTTEESPRERIERRLAGLKVVGGTDSDTEAA